MTTDHNCLKRDVEHIRSITDKLAKLAYAFEDTGNDVVCVKLLAYRTTLYEIYDAILASLGGIENGLADAISKIEDCDDGKINFRRDFADRLKDALRVINGVNDE